MKALPATIKIFLVSGDPRGLRTAEISNWSGKGAAAPRSELEEWDQREELRTPGVYVLTGEDPERGALAAYVGEAESLRGRVRQHTERDFWVHVYAFFSKDENLTKAHIRYLEGRIIDEARAAGRMQILNSQSSGALLPESDRADMEVFLERVRQLLPVLGSNLLVPPPIRQAKQSGTSEVTFERKHVRATGSRTPDGFVVFAGSQAVPEMLPSSAGTGNFADRRRQELVELGILVAEDGYLRFVEDVEFSSPSGAASVIAGGNTNGLLAWKDGRGRTLKELEAGDGE